MDGVDCIKCGASHIVEDGEAWSAEHAHPGMVIVTPLDDMVDYVSPTAD